MWDPFGGGMLCPIHILLRIANCKVHLGDTVTLWNDSWDLGNLKVQFPQLCSFAKNGNIFVAKFHAQDAHQNFFTPLSEIASEQLQTLSSLVLVFYNFMLILITRTLGIINGIVQSLWLKRFI